MEELAEKGSVAVAVGVAVAVAVNLGCGCGFLVSVLLSAHAELSPVCRIL